MHIDSPVVLRKEIQNVWEVHFEEIIRKEQTPREQGESDIKRMLDTSRAIPSVSKIKIRQRFEQSGTIEQIR